MKVPNLIDNCANDSQVVVKKTISKRPRQSKKETPYMKALKAASSNIKEQALTELRHTCPHCKKKFSSEKLATVHRTLNTRSCIGQWFVCKRCLKMFDCQSELKIHQSKLRICEDSIYVKQSLNKNIPPPELVNQLRMEKGTKDLGSVDAYLRNVVLRAEKTEIFPTLEVCTLDQLKIFLNIVEHLSTVERLESIGFLAEFSNKVGVSPEKAVLVKAFVIRHTTL